MSTPYSNIYDKATKTLQSYTFASLTQSTFEAFFRAWLDEAVSIYFIDCETDLSDVDDTLKKFNKDLTSREQWILAYSICLSWLSFNINNEQKLVDRIGDRDYQIHSPANLLKSLISVYEIVKKRLNDALEMYSYRDMSFADHL